MAKSVYDLIKRQNGEHFAQTIRNYDSGIFDIPNIVHIVKYAGRDAAPILKYLESLKIHESKVTHAAAAPEQSWFQNWRRLFHLGDGNSLPDPFKLLHRAGYRAEYADTLEKQNSIKKYFARGEELCTFSDPARYKNYYIINAVRYDVDKIRRENFIHPKRQDAYGTSVISIQMAKGGGFISIKNRYNHTVESPDNTYNSNPDNIIDGLSASLMQYFNINFNSTNRLPAYYVLVGDQVVHHSFEINGVILAEDLYVKNGKIIPINKSYQMMMDNFVFDMSTNTMTEISGTKDSFPALINDQIRGKKLSITKDRAHGITHIFADGMPIINVRNGRIIWVNMSNIRVIPDDCLMHCSALESIDVSNAESIGKSFAVCNDALKSLDVSGAKTIGKGFLTFNQKLTKLIVRDDVEIDGLTFNKRYRRIAPADKELQFRHGEKNVVVRAVVEHRTNKSMEH